MSSRTRKLLRRGLWLVGALAAIAVVYLLVLVYPAPLFEHHQRFGDFRVYSDEPIPEDFGRVIEGVKRRMAAMEHAPERGDPRVFLCESRERYGWFAFLTRKTPDSLAIGLSVANEMFVSTTRVREFAARNPGVFRHTRFEGNLAEVVAHEIAHFRSVEALGYRAHLALPVWKSEGWAEYQANLAALREDPAYDLRARIDLLLDDRFWGEGPGIARSLWEWQLLVEYLGEVEGYLLADLVREDVTRAAVRARMLDWYRQPR